MNPITFLALAVLVPVVQDEPGGLAVLCAKAVTCADDPDVPQVIDRAVVLIEDGKIVAVGEQGELAIPAGYRVEDHGDAWVVPGLLDLHSHVGQEGMLADWNDGAYQNNPGLRVSVSAEPGNQYLQRACAGGVTVVLYLPGSGTNMSGAAVLMKTAPHLYEDASLDDVSALKIAQAGNPERWGPRMARTWMNWNLRNTIRRGQLYAAAWKAFETGEGPEPERNPMFDVFREIGDGEAVVAVHTQIYQVFLMTLTMLKQELGLPIFIAHGTFDSYRAAELANSLGVPAILGPRSMNRSINARGFAEIDTDGRLEGIAAGYQERGYTDIGFNTDAINPNFGSQGPWTEELPLQGAMGVRYGLTNERVDVLRGLTIVAARTVGVDDRLGSLEVGKDADLVISDGDPTDPRNRVDCVYIEGERVYDRDETPTVW